MAICVCIETLTAKSKIKEMFKNICAVVHCSNVSVTTDIFDAVNGGKRVSMSRKNVLRTGIQMLHRLEGESP